MQNLIFALFDVTEGLLNVLVIVIIIRALASWVQPDPKHTLVQLLNRFTDPVLKPIARYVPSFRGIELTPLIAILIIQGFQWLVIEKLQHLLLG